MNRTLLAVSALLVLTAGTRLQAQQATSASAGDRPIPAWLVRGAFPVDTGALRLERDYLGGEAEAAPVAGAAGWRRADADDTGALDYTALLEAPLERAAAYALVYITSPADRTVTIALESDDDALAWLNGRLVYRAEVARGMGRADTVTLRLSKGTNRLLTKVINRTGGFGVGVRLLALSADPIADLGIATDPPAGALAGDPAPWVTLSPARLGSAARLADGELLVDVAVELARWGGIAQPVQVLVGERAFDVPQSPAGRPERLAMAAPWRELAALIEAPSVRVRWGGREVRTAFPLQPGELLAVLSRAIVAGEWEQTTSALRFHSPVPAVLAGLTLTADVAEFVPGGSFLVNGREMQPDARERLTLCSPCAAGANLAVELRPNGGEWWDPPRLRIEEAGWRELEDAAGFSRVLAADSTIALPETAAARELLQLALQPDKRAYLVRLDRLRAPLRSHEAFRADTIDLVGNSHIDAAWLWRWPETVDVVRNTWRTAVKLLDKYPEMRFAASSARYYAWLEEYEPELLAKIVELQRTGRWIVTGGWWVEPDVNTPAGESLVRQGLYGQRTLMRIFGEPATVGWIPDTFGYPWTLPQLMAGAGLTSFITQKLRWNENGWSADRNFFLWEGPDGTRIPTYIPFGYDHDLRADRLVREWRTQQDSAATGRVLTLYGVGDHGGGPTMEMLDRRRDAERVPVLPVLRDVDPATSVATMLAGAPDAPVIRDELYFEYHRGVQTSQALMKLWNRRMEATLLAAEAAAVSVLGAPPRTATPALVARAGAREQGGGAVDYPHADLRRAWQLTLFNQFHDILPGSSIAGVYEDALADYRVADSLAQGALASALGRLAERLDTRSRVPGAVPWVVFNPSAVARTELVSFPAPAGSARVLDRDRALTAHVRGDSIHALVQLPALSTRVLFVAPGGGRAAVRESGRNVLENEWLRVEIDTVTGAIARLYDRRLQREVLAPGTQGNVLMTMADTPREWDAWNIDHTDGPWTPVDSAVVVGRVRHTPLGDELTVVRARPDVHAQQRYFLPRHAARLDIASTIAWHASHQLLKAFFPLAVGADSVHAEIPYGAVARVARPRTRADSAKFELPMQRWIDASRGGWGVSLVNDAKHGYDVRGDTLRLSLLRAPKYPDPNADMGTHHFTYAIVPHAGDWRSGATFEAAESLNRPFRVQRTDVHAGVRALPPPLTLAGTGVELGALKLAEDGTGWIVRLVERHGRAATARLQLPGGVQWRDVDFVERPAGDWQPLSDGRADVQLRPWQIRTVEVRRQ